MAVALQDEVVRMGESRVAAGDDAVLTCIGLGSCIGLALLDRRARIAGLAHVMLPTAGEHGGRQPAKYGDTALEALREDLLASGAARHRLEAVLVGGAQMFGGRGSADIGARNAAAVHAALAAARVPVRAQELGGSQGRTMKVHPGAGRVTCRQAATGTVELLGPRP